MIFVTIKIRFMFYLTKNYIFYMNESSLKTNKLIGIFCQVQDSRSHINRPYNLIDILSHWCNFSGSPGRNIKTDGQFCKIKRIITKNFS